jgi:hypothetical protein
VVLVSDVDVLLVAYGGGHVAMLAPLAQQLSHRGLNVKFLALTTARQYLSDRGIAFFGYSDFPEAADSQVQALGRSLCQDVAQDGRVPLEESIAYMGINYSDLIDEHGADGAEKRYRQFGRQAFLPVSPLRRLLERMRPKLVIATNASRSEQAVLLAAQGLDVSRFCLVDLFGFHAKWITSPGFANTICVINDDVRDYFIAQGCPPDTVVATGSPAFDRINTPENQASGRQWRQSHGIDDEARVILWASQVEPARHPYTGAAGNPDLPERIEAQLRDIQRRHEDWHLIVRHHPSESRSFEPADRVIFSPTSEPLHPLLHAADTVVIMTSTVGVEAQLAGAHVLTVEMSVITPDVPYSRYGIAEAVSSLDELEEKIAIGERCGSGGIKPVGQATQKIADLVQAAIEAAGPVATNARQ